MSEERYQRAVQEEEAIRRSEQLEWQQIGNIASVGYYLYLEVSAGGDYRALVIPPAGPLPTDPQILAQGRLAAVLEAVADQIEQDVANEIGFDRSEA